MNRFSRLAALSRRVGTKPESESSKPSDFEELKFSVPAPNQMVEFLSSEEMTLYPLAFVQNQIKPGMDEDHLWIAIAQANAFLPDGQSRRFEVIGNIWSDTPPDPADPPLWAAFGSTPEEAKAKLIAKYHVKPVPRPEANPRSHPLDHLVTMGGGHIGGRK